MARPTGGKRERGFVVFESFIQLARLSVREAEKGKGVRILGPFFGGLLQQLDRVGSALRFDGDTCGGGKANCANHKRKYGEHRSGRDCSVHDISLRPMDEPASALR